MNKAHGEYELWVQVPLDPFSGVLSDHSVLFEGRGWLSDAHPLMAVVVGGISHAGMGW